MGTLSDTEAAERGLWQAVLTRDRKLDGAFVYAVRSTGIYCRPTCPSRRPRRESVLFFSDVTAARRAQFRPCLRCHPGPANALDPNLEMVRRLCDYIQNQEGSAPTLDGLGRSEGVSAGRVQRAFKAALGISPRQFASACRLDRFKARLKEGWDITEALYDVGYGSSSRLYEASSGHLGMSPATYRRGGRGARIAHTIVNCRLGRLLVAATESGICSVKLGDNDQALETSLHEEYPEAEHEAGGPDAFRDWVETIRQYLDGGQTNLNLPLDVWATAFQRRVWEYLRAIPYGQTKTYHDVAQDLGQPAASRAVGHACASNPVSLVVPCHRVLRKDGGLGGYRWGLDRKSALLERERSPGGAKEAQ